MATVSAYRNGLTLGIGGGNPNPAKRSTITGWSPGAVRRHTAWLYSVNAPALDGNGLALMLTLRDCPDSAEEFHRARRNWIKRIERMGATRVHWVIEWQRRGVPHLHCAVYFGEGVKPQQQLWLMVSAWLDVAAPWSPQFRAQHGDEIDGPLGWLQYLSKHAARGVRHYQRNGKPDGWATTGRLWGHTGQWPVDVPLRFDMSREAYWRYRRLVRSWRIADARASGNPRRISAARRMLACDQPKLSAVRGVSDWVPEDVAMALVAMLAGEGHSITQKHEQSPEPPPAVS